LPVKISVGQRHQLENRVGVRPESQHPIRKIPTQNQPGVHQNKLVSCHDQF